jgi:hypothetical protein
MGQSTGRDLTRINTATGPVCTFSSANPEAKTTIGLTAITTLRRAHDKEIGFPSLALRPLRLDVAEQTPPVAIV